jgi:GT2 family glycosyltransferase/glycosyltransferase involved in cell wall biosynthesis
LARAALAEIAAARPDIVHFQHLTCLSTGLPEAVASLGVPSVMTLNDYWLICHRGQLFDRDGQRCDGPYGAGCGRCIEAGALAPTWVFDAGRRALASVLPAAGLLAHAGGLALAAVTRPHDLRSASLARLAHMRCATRHVGLFLVPSRTAEARFREFGIEPARLRRCEQGIDLRPFARISRAPSPALRVAFAGGLLPSKGAHVLLAAAASLAPGRVSVDVLGDVSSVENVRHYAALTTLLGAPVVLKLGSVPHGRMGEALGSVDVVAVPSLWLENAPFVIREAFAAGAPVVASNLGGMAEMVRHDVDGLLVEAGSVPALAAALDRLAGDPPLLARLRSGIRAPLSIDDDASTLLELYTSMAVRRGSGRGSEPAAPPTRLGAVVLNYRTPDQTWLAVRSLQTSTRVPDHIVVVDNGSGDGSPAQLRASLERVDLVGVERNLGFAGGCNAGVDRLRGQAVDFVLLVNSDVVLHPAAVSRLVAAAHAHPSAGVLGPVLLSREEPDRIASAGVSYRAATGRMRQRAAGLPLSRLQPSQPHEVDAISGAVMLIRSNALARAGGLDDQYFFYFEDIDFCLRARAVGFTSVCVPDAIGYHEGGRTIGRRSAGRMYYAARNHLRLASRTGSQRAPARAARAAVVLGLNVAYASVSSEVPTAGGLLAIFRGARDHLRGRYGPR